MGKRNVAKLLITLESPNDSALSDAIKQLDQFLSALKGVEFESHPIQQFLRQADGKDETLTSATMIHDSEVMSNKEIILEALDW